MNKNVYMHAESRRESFDRLFSILQILRSPEGCPWDKEQTPLTMRDALIEEVYECIEAIENDDHDHIKEELGDIYLVVTMVTLMYEEEHLFRIEDVLNSVSDKLVRRHPHVFSDGLAETSEEVLKQWNDIKKNLEGRNKDSVLDDIPVSFPPLLRSLKIQKRVAKQGFDWDDSGEIIEKIKEEIDEWIDARKEKRKERLEEEMGDILFSLVNLCRREKIDPSLAIENCNKKFISRYRFIEDEMKKNGLTPSKELRPEMEDLWNQAKKNEK